MFSLIIPLFFLFFIPAVLTDCSAGWQKILNGCYQFSISTKVTWAAAHARCRSVSGDLAVLNSSGILDAIIMRLKQMSITQKELFVGFLRSKKWVWNGGGTVDTGLWKPGFPKFLVGDSCTAFIGGWIVDVSCDLRYGFICAKGTIQKLHFHKIRTFML